MPGSFRRLAQLVDRAARRPRDMPWCGPDRDYGFADDDARLRDVPPRAIRPLAFPRAPPLLGGARAAPDDDDAAVAAAAGGGGGGARASLGRALAGNGLFFVNCLATALYVIGSKPLLTAREGALPALCVTA